MADVGIDTSGIKDIVKLMQQLPDSVNKKILASAERTALNPVRKSMQQLLASRTVSRTGRLKNSIGVKLLRSSSPYQVTTIAGARYGGRFGAPHAHLVEAGTAERQHKTSGFVKFVLQDGVEVIARVQKTGRVEARHFMRDSISAQKDQVIRSMNSQVLKSLSRYMNKLDKKFGKH